MKKCPYCNAQLTDGSKFCSECGKEYPQGNTCPHCGASVCGDDVFCQSCGKKLPNRIHEDIDILREKTRDEDKKALNNIFPYILVVIALVAICVGGWLICNNYKAHKSQELAKEKTRKDMQRKRFVADSLRQVSINNLAVACAKYDYVSGFSEGLAQVIKDDKWGFIDKNGKEVVPCIYEGAGDFSEGLASVRKDDKWGFIDKNGKEVVPCIYETAQEGDADGFSEGFAQVVKDGKWGFIDKNGKEVVPCIYLYAGSFSEGLASVNKDYNFGCIDKRGNEVVPCIHAWVGSFSEGLAQVRKGYKNGFIDKNGKEVVPCIYDYVSGFSEGLAQVIKDDKWGFIDKNGKEVVPCIYEGAGDFSEGLASVRKDEWGFIDKNGKEVVPCIYEGAESFSEGLASVRKDDKWGFIDKNGKEVVPCIYDEACSFSEGFALASKDDKWGFIDKKGNSTFDVRDEEVKKTVESIILERKKARKEKDNDLEWLQGHWVYEQGRYKAHFIIQGDKIIQYTSTIPERQENNFIIEDGAIRARLIDGLYLVVPIDFANHTIDYGDGNWMHKVESSRDDFSSSDSNISPSSSKTFANEQYVTMYLANQSFRDSGGLTIRFDGQLRMYIDNIYAGVVSVLRYNSSSALLRYGGGMYDEGKIVVHIVGNKLQLTDPIDDTVYYQQGTSYFY